MRKPDFTYAKTKAQISFAVTAQLISAFVFATRLVQFLFFLNLKIRLSLSTTFQTVRNFFHTKDLFQPIRIKENFNPKVGLTTESNKPKRPHN